MMFLSRGKVKILSSGLLVMNIFLVSLLFRDKKKTEYFRVVGFGKHLIVF